MWKRWVYLPHLKSTLSLLILQNVVGIDILHIYAFALYAYVYDYIFDKRTNIFVPFSSLKWNVFQCFHGKKNVLLVILNWN